uniref:Uncharacterized protein n=1 Tax=Rhizophora mucronata TaxID=61149 RepID=A0A2P2LLT8_RHIMU
MCCKMGVYMFYMGWYLILSVNKGVWYLYLFQLV